MSNGSRAERPLFDEALAGFRDFLRSEGRTDRLLWISRDRVVGRKLSLWLYRPYELTSDLLHRKYYEELRITKTSIRIDTLCELPGAMVAYVHNHGGEGGHLNYGIELSERKVFVVTSRIRWFFIRAACRLFGESPFLRDIQLPEPTSGLAPGRGSL